MKKAILTCLTIFCFLSALLPIGRETSANTNSDMCMGAQVQNSTLLTPEFRESYHMSTWEFRNIANKSDILTAIDINRTENTVVTAGRIEEREVSGFYNVKWFVEKRNNSDLSLIKNVTLDGEVDKTTEDWFPDEPEDIALGSDNSIYIAGFETNLNGAKQWLVRRLDYDLNPLSYFEWSPSATDDHVADSVAVQWGDEGQRDRIFVVGYSSEDFNHKWVIFCLNATSTGLEPSQWAGPWPKVIDYTSEPDVAVGVAVDQDNDILVIAGRESTGTHSWRTRTLFVDLRNDTWHVFNEQVKSFGTRDAPYDVEVHPVGTNTEVYVVGYGIEDGILSSWLVQKYTVENRSSVVEGWSDIGIDVLDSSTEIAEGVDVSLDGKVIVVGFVNNDPVIRPFNNQWFIKVYDSDGEILWEELREVSEGTDQGDELFDAVVDSDGNLTVVGDVHIPPSDEDFALAIAKYTKSHQIYVDDDNIAGPWDGTPEYPYQNITSGLERATTNDMIFVHSGTYYEHIVVNKTVSIHGEDKNNTTIDGNRTGNVVTITAINVSIEGFRIQNSENDTENGHDSGFLLNNTSQCKIVNNIIANNGVNGIRLSNSSNNEILENTIAYQTSLHTYDGKGIKVWKDSLSNVISRNTIFSNNQGVEIYSSENIVSENNITDNFDAVIICDATGNIICNNKVINNFWGGIVLLFGADNNTVFGNIITNNDDGIWFASSSNNSIYHNSFINNTDQVYNEFSVNIWDDGYPSGGNYWSDYGGQDENSDGIGDSIYQDIGMDKPDNYPLMGMFYDSRATSEHRVQTICNSTISNFQFNGTAISFSVSGENGIFGFCRLTIPHALLSPPYNVTVNNSLVAYTPVFENDTLSIIYINYTLSTKEVVIVPEFPSFRILPLLMAATLLAVLLYKRKFPLKKL